MKTYENYHTHKDGSNVYVPDTPMMFSDYLKRTEELGHNSISSIEHGWVGNYFSDYLQLEKHNKKREKEGKPPLKWIYGGEFYWVKYVFGIERYISVFYPYYGAYDHYIIDSFCS